MHPRTYAIFGYLGAFGAAFGGMALTAALLGDREGRLWWPLSRLGSAGMLRACGVTNLHVEGAEQLAECGPAVVVVNHESLFDPAVVMRSLPDPVRFIVKREVRRVPVFGAALARMGHVFVDRGGDGRGERALDEAAAAIAAGTTVLVFPEGTRAEGDDLLPFKSGGFRLALRARVPVVPAALFGTRQILPKRGGFQRPGPVAFMLGAPIPTAVAPPPTVDQLMAVARREMLVLRADARRRCGA